MIRELESGDKSKLASCRANEINPANLSFL